MTTLTVSDLIAALSKLPGDLPVYDNTDCFVVDFEVDSLEALPWYVGMARPTSDGDPVSAALLLGYDPCDDNHADHISKYLDDVGANGPIIR